MTRILTPFLALISIGIATPASAYWEYGHETIGEIAYRNITPETRRAVDALLHQSKLLETPNCKAGTIEQAAIWADCIKTLGPRFSYAYDWHYQNVNICKPFDLKGPCKDGNCVSAQIERDVKLLKDKSVPVRERVQALAFLIHFVGDLHQPLHAGDRGDLGGNQVLAAYGDYAPEKLNLHSIWDGYLAERAISTPPSPVRVYSAAERAELQLGSVEDWSHESWQVAHDVAYASALGGDACGPEPKRAKLDQATIARILPAAKLEVERGGLRLAKLLDEALG
uniref:S1/P1 nuclease n=1 Tax=Sphingomonas sp. TaxID=28214 RepID=UPI0025CE8CE4|nr:S1/P1 nuclease [Sphingomonas sp.]